VATLTLKSITAHRSPRPSARVFAQLSNKAALIKPADMTRDQVTETRRVLREMNEKAERAIDDQVARSTPMTPKK
jgi:hypothetical protein